MVGRKSTRTRGKVSISKYFKEFKEGDKVALNFEREIPTPTTKRLQGRTGVIAGKRGRAYIVSLMDQAKEKTFLIYPIHLNKIREGKK